MDFWETVFVPDHVVAMVAEPGGMDIVRAAAAAYDAGPMFFEFMVVRSRLGAGHFEGVDDASQHYLPRSEGRREMALDLLSLVRVGRMETVEINELIETRLGGISE